MAVGDLPNDESFVCLFCLKGFGIRLIHWLECNAAS